MTQKAGDMLSDLVGGIGVRENRLQLEELLARILEPAEGIESDAAEDLPEVVARLNVCKNLSRKTSFWFMVNLMQLAMHVHR